LHASQFKELLPPFSRRNSSIASGRELILRTRTLFAESEPGISPGRLKAYAVKSHHHI